MPKTPVTITIDDRELELHARFYELDLLHELTGIDLLDPATYDDREAYEKAWRSPRNLLLAVYAFAGGEERTGWTLEEYKRRVTLADGRSLDGTLALVMKRDMGANERPGKEAPAEDTTAGSSNS